MMSEDKNGTPCFKALGSLDFARLYSMSGAEGAAFDGVWTGFHFMHTFTARNAERVPLHMAAVRTESGGNKLLALDQDGSEVKDAGGAGVESMIVTRFMDFQAPVDTKALKHVELWLSGIACDSSLAVYFRPRGVSGWTLAGSKTFNVPDGSEPQSRRRVNLPITVEEIGCDPVTGDKLNVATQVQFAIVWTGRLKLDRFRVIAGLRTDENTACDAEDNPDNNTYAGSGVELDYLRYSAGI
jgi:hypothetical protein